MSHVTGATWHVTCDRWHIRGDIWHVTHDAWHMTCGEHCVRRWTLWQNFRSLTLMVLDLWCFEDLEEKDLNQWLGDRGDCRTAPATPGLLNIIILQLAVKHLKKYLHFFGGKAPTDLFVFKKTQTNLVFGFSPFWNLNFGISKLNFL